MELKKIKIDSKKLLSGASLVLGIAGMLVSNKVQANDRNTMKSELKEELLKEMLENK
jgi:hypothetical protein